MTLSGRVLLKWRAAVLFDKYALCSLKQSVGFPKVSV